jgi:arylsulfatase A-like enzyme
MRASATRQNIDQLAAEGLHLTNSYANAAICSPRAPHC